MSQLKQSKKASPVDWHPADIKAALEKAGWSLRRLSQRHGYNPNLLKRALAHPYPNAERLIADAIGVTPENIWPSRYLPDGRHATNVARSDAATRTWVNRRSKYGPTGRASNGTTEGAADNGNVGGANRQ